MSIKRKVTVLIFSMILLCGCGSEKKTMGEIASTIYGSGYSSYNEAYATYIEESAYNENECHYALIYLDEDSQPELFVEGNSSADGEQVLTFYNGELRTLRLSRLGSEHIPGKGMLYNNCGHMDYYPVYIYKLYKGDFYITGKGIWGGLDWKDGMELDENGEPDYQFEWEGERCTEEEFYEKIDEIFPLDEGMRPMVHYTREEMLDLLAGW